MPPAGAKSAVLTMAGLTALVFQGFSTELPLQCLCWSCARSSMLQRQSPLLWKGKYKKPRESIRVIKNLLLLNAALRGKGSTWFFEPASCTNGRVHEEGILHSQGAWMESWLYLGTCREAKAGRLLMVCRCSCELRGPNNPVAQKAAIRLFYFLLAQLP